MLSNWKKTGSCGVRLGSFGTGVALCKVLNGKELDSAMGKTDDYFSCSGFISQCRFSWQEQDTKAGARFDIPNAKGIVVARGNNALPIGA